MARITTLIGSQAQVAMSCDTMDTIEIKPEHTELAKQIIDWVEAGEGFGKSDYLWNLFVALRVGHVTERTLGIVASAVPTFQRELQRRREAEHAAKTSEHFGQAKERLTFTAQVVAVIPIESYYGVKRLTKLITPEGNVVIWWNSGTTFPERGKTYRVKGTVKGHDVRDGVKQTIVQRCTFEEVQS